MTNYIHGYSEGEQERLRQQAEFMEFTVYQDVNFSPNHNVLEVGSGVGAQSQILLRRFPQLKLTCVDISEEQLATAKQALSKLKFADGRYELHKMNAEKLSFPDDTFDGAFMCWVLEHMPKPTRVLQEIRRVLKPRASLVITETMNFTFFLDPYCPAIWKYWMTMNDYQYDRGGDPFVGVKLGNFLRDSGYTDVETKMKEFYVDKRQPEFREKVLVYWRELMFSGAEELLKAEKVTREHVEAMKKEFAAILTNPDAILFDVFMQATARVP